MEDKERSLKLSILIRYIILIWAAVIMAFCLSANVYAAVPSSVSDSRDCVMQIIVSYQDESGTDHTLQTGSGFLINSRYVATCSHVVEVSDEDVEDVALHYGRTMSQIRDGISIYVMDGTQKISTKVSIDNSSLDFAALRLDTKIKDRSVAKIRKSSELQKNEKCFAVGYPGSKADTTGTVADSVVSQGIVERLVYFSDNIGYTYVENTARIQAGDSGGALFDRYGSVVGVLKAISTASSGNRRYFAVSTDDVEYLLDSSGIKYSRESRAVEITGNAAYQVTSYKGRTAQVIDLYAYISNIAGSDSRVREAAGSYQYIQKVSIKSTVKIDGRTYKVTSICKNAFRNKKYLKSVTIGKNVQQIGAGTFSGCSRLEKLTINSVNLTSVGKNAIKKISASAVINVPKSQKKAYKKLFKPATGYKKTMKIKAK